MTTWIAWIAIGAVHEARALRRDTVPLSHVLRLIPLPARWMIWGWAYFHFLRRPRGSNMRVRLRKQAH